MSAIIGSDIRSGIGARLRSGRERAGLTLLQVAEKLHVDAKVIESLEAERFDALGAPVFVKGHLRHYSELIGEQTGELLDMYSAATKPVLPDLTQLPKVGPASNPRRLVVPALVVLIGIAVVGSVWWVLQNLEPGKIVVKTPTAPREVAETLPADAVAPDTVLAEGGEPPAAPTPAAAVAPMGAAALPASHVVPSSNAPAAPLAQAPAPADAARVQTVDVTLRFASDSWVEVYDANGKRLFYDIGSASSSRKVSGTAPLRVVLGNAPGVTLDVNGKPAAVPAEVVRDETAQFLINRSGRIVRTRSPTDGG